MFWRVPSPILCRSVLQYSAPLLFSIFLKYKTFMTTFQLVLFSTKCCLPIKSIGGWINTKCKQRSVLRNPSVWIKIKLSLVATWLRSQWPNYSICFHCGESFSVSESEYLAVSYLDWARPQRITTGTMLDCIYLCKSCVNIARLKLRGKKTLRANQLNVCEHVSQKLVDLFVLSHVLKDTHNEQNSTRIEQNRRNNLKRWDYPRPVPNTCIQVKAVR